MQSKLVLFIALSLVCLQICAAGPLYNLSDKRYLDLLSRANSLLFADQKSTLLTFAVSSFGFNCTQVRGLLDSFSTDGDKIIALSLFVNNIVDPTNKQKQIIDLFTLPEDKQRATQILNNIVACKVVPYPNDPYPVWNIPYTNIWIQEDLIDLIKVLTKVPIIFNRIRIAELAINSRTQVLSPDQALLLFSAFSDYRDILILREIIKERMVGLSTQHLSTFLERFSYESMKSNILDTLQCANNNSTCIFNSDLVSIADFIHNNLLASTCDKVSPIAEKFAFEDQKLEILEGFSSAVVDYDNRYSLLSSFSIANQERAKKIIDNFKPNSYIFGAPSGKIVFVLDVSGSMSTSFRINGTQTMSRLDFVRREFTRVVNGLNENKTAFNVLAFADRVVAWNTGLVNATQANIKSAAEFGSKYPASGGTNSWEALKTAMSYPGVENIYFLSDGNPSVGTKTSTSAIISDVKSWNTNGKIKIHSIALIMGTTSGENKTIAKEFMKGLSEATGGAYRILESDN